MSTTQTKGAASDVGRSDLVFLLQTFPDTPPERIAALLGYDYAPRANISEPGTTVPPHRAPAGDDAAPRESTAAPYPVDAKFWCVTEREMLRTPDVGEEAPRVSGELPDIMETNGPPFSPLVPWAGVWPFLKDVLHGRRFSREPDEGKTIARIARGEPLSEIPRKERKTWADRAHIVMDMAPRLFPFWGDFNQVINGAALRLGETRLAVSRLRNGPFGLDFDPRSMTCSDFVVRPHERRVLLLSDLGVYGGPADRDAWRRFGERMRSQGARPVVFCPAPVRLWAPEHAGLFHRIPWDDTAPRPKLRGPNPTDGVVEGAGEQDVETLLALCSTAVRVEPRLLRVVRRLMPGADVGVEGRAWNHSAVTPTYLAFSYKLEFHDAYRRKLQSLEEKPLCKAALQCIQDFHRFLPPEVQLEERLAQRVLGPNAQGALAVDEELQQFLAWFGKEQAEMSDPEEVHRWLRRMAWRQPPELGDLPEARDMREKIAQAFAQELERGGQAPRLIQERDVAAVRDGEPTPSKEWRIVQRGEKLFFESSETENSAIASMGSVLARVAARDFVEIPQGGIGAKYVLQDDLVLELPTSAPFCVSTSETTLTLDVQGKPDWAESISQGAVMGARSPAPQGYGLFASLPFHDSVIAWTFPRTVAQDYLGDMFSDLPGDGEKEKSQWINLTRLEALTPQERPDFSWANEHGVDQFGLWAAFEINGVRQVMRWIPPGEFMMGSPEHEPGRSRDEFLHQVALTQGYWLADTACTQELWTAVMEKNPSRFKDAGESPVENVSWDDCATFLDRVNTLFPALNLRLPTEAQWEYACRAGTTTPFSFGENITPDQVNYDGNFPYNDGSKGQNRKQTIGVKDLPSNPWGLYQMHGNVWEWCADWYEEYTVENQENPQGPDTGEDRVLRGGNWIGHGRGVRSAYRNRFAPGNRFSSTGFRFSRGLSGAGGQGEA